jgi:hypothetical protein
LSYELHTNDPRLPLIKLSLTGRVKPLPDFVKRVSNADIAHGDQSGPFKIWPTVRPTLTFEPGERLGFSIRIRPTPADATLQLKSDPSKNISYRLRRDPSGGGYWLDIEAGPLSESVTQQVLLVAQLADGTSPELALAVTINVPAHNLVFTPQSVDLGEVSREDFERGSRRAGRLGIRKQAGSFHIKSITSTLAFLKLEQQAIVDGSNYLIRIILEPGKPPKAGAYAGTIRIETDDKQSPVIEVPIKVTLK